MISSLLSKKCIPCYGKVPALGSVQAKKIAEEIPGWLLSERDLSKTFDFKNFLSAMKFVNRVAELAEAEAHHPDIFIQYNKVKILTWTHAANGLTENDFILAAKIDVLEK